MTHPPAAAREVRLTPDGRLDEDIACLRCGYDLRMQLPDGVCPECGTAVGRSVQGNFLRFSPPDWVDTLASGMNWIVANIVISLLGGIAIAAVVRSIDLAVNPRFLAHLLSIVGVIGYWKLTTPDPSRLDAPSLFDVANLVRISTVVAYLAELAGQAGGWPPVLAAILGATAAIVGLVQIFSVFVYARRLALRIPDLKLASETRTVMWGLVITMIVSAAFGFYLAVAGPQSTGGTPAMMCVVGVGALVFGLLSLGLILRYRRRLNDAALEARATWARPAGEARPVQAQ